MKIRKALATIIAVTTMAVGTGILNTSAHSFTPTDKHTEVDSYLNEVIDGYMPFSGTNVEEVYISQSYNVSDAECESYIYFLFNQEDIFGEITMMNIDDVWVSSFIPGEFESVQNAYEVGAEIRFFSTQATETADGIENVIVLGDEKNDQCVMMEVGEGASFERKSVHNNYDVDVCDYGDGNTTPIDNVNCSASSSSAASIRSMFSHASTLQNCKFLECPLADNGSTSSGDGLCWAATGCSIIGYKTGEYFTKTSNGGAEYIYSQLDATYLGTPSGTKYWIELMWSYFDVDMTYVGHKLSYSTIYSQLNSNKPIYASFKRVNEDGDQVAAHGVALCGTYYNTSNSTYYYIYMDPNISKSSSKYVICTVVESTRTTSSGTTFYYSDGTSGYNNWYRAWY